jgi:mono/diheme cytochrome c family protein
LVATACACGPTGTPDTAPPVDTDPPVDTGSSVDTGPPETTDTSTSDARIAAIVALDGDVANGEALYRNTCVLCHGVDGKGSNGEFSGADLTVSTLDEVGVVTTLVRGRPATRMASYAYESDEQLADLAAYLLDAFIPGPHSGATVTARCR